MEGSNKTVEFAPDELELYKILYDQIQWERLPHTENAHGIKRYGSAVKVLNSQADKEGVDMKTLVLEAIGLLRLQYLDTARELSKQKISVGRIELWGSKEKDGVLLGWITAQEKPTEPKPTEPKE